MTNKTNTIAKAMTVAPVDWTKFRGLRVMNRMKGHPRCRAQPLSSSCARRGGQFGSCSRSLPPFGFPQASLPVVIYQQRREQRCEVENRVAERAPRELVTVAAVERHRVADEGRAQRHRGGEIDPPAHPD